jgi:hypothetical protein
MGKLKDLTGQRFGRLTVCRRVENSNDGRVRWLCLCECGNEIVVLGYSLVSGNTRSCGCLNKELITQRRTTHGHSKGKKMSPTYQSWSDMMQRCYNPKCKEYLYYGERDIKVYEPWHIFENFLADMGECPKGLTIERIDNEGHYNPENCKWDTRKNQARNRRSNKILTLNGVSHCSSEWTEILGWSINLIGRRVYDGWTDEEILTTKPGERRKK